MTPQPDALPACPHGNEPVTGEFGYYHSKAVPRRFRIWVLNIECQCEVSGPDEQSARAAWSALCAPHALAASRAECERLRVALFDTSEVCAALVEGEKCEHDAGICWCAAHESIVHARAALAAQGGGT